MRIKEVRLSKNIQQKELASLVGIAANTLSQYESGKREPDLAMLQKIADALMVSTDYLLGRTDQNYVAQYGDSMFAERLKKLRHEKDLTQAQLAAELNVAGGTIAMWETGKREPNFAITMQIADFFSTSTDYLLGYSSSPPQQTLQPMEISPVEDALLYTYRVASPDDREIMDNIIRRYNVGGEGM